MTGSDTATDSPILSGAKTNLNETSLFSDFVEQRYMPFIERNKRSWKVDRGNLRRHILPYLGSRRLCDITDATLKEWVDALALAGLSHNSCFRQFWIAKYILNCAVRWGVLASDAAFKTATLSKTQGRRPVLLSSPELVRLTALLREQAHRPAANAIHLMLLTGASKSEILSARWEDLDLARGVLTAQENFTGRRRMIPLNGEALKLIQTLPRRAGVPWLFSTSRGTRLSCITRDWKQLRERFGRPELRLQDLRHSFAGFIMSMGASRYDMQAVLGGYKPETLALAHEAAQEKGRERLA